LDQSGVLVEEAIWNRADVVILQIPKRKRVGMRRMKGKTRTREHKNLQSGQQSVLVEEAIWNRADLVNLQAPKRKEVGMRQIEKKNKNTGTQRLTKWSKRCSRRGSHLELC